MALGRARESPHEWLMTLASVQELVLGKLQAWLNAAIEMLPNALLALLAILFFGLVSRRVEKLVVRLVFRLSNNRPISEIIGGVARVATVIFGIFSALSLLSLERTVTSLLAGVGVVGIALGFAFQDIAANFMSGILMALRRPFDVGDLVEVGGRLAKVQRIELRATVLMTLDGLVVVLPNKEIFQNPIVNYTVTKGRRLDVQVGTAYSDDLERVRDVTVEALQKLEGRDPDEKVEVLFEAFGDSSINHVARIWLLESDELNYRRCRSEAIIAIKKAYDAADITIPFPIRTLDFGAAAVGGERLDTMKLGSAMQAAE